MKIVLLTNDGPNQRALANKLAGACDLAAIVISKNVPKKKKPPQEQARIFLNAVEARVVGRPFVKAWRDIRARYERAYPGWPSAPRTSVVNVNDPATIGVIDEHAPDYVFVSGTNLVGPGVVKAAGKRGGVLNLHTGISPYIKGGPNCTNWCLAEGMYHLIGSTVMWLDLGIDTGHLIATERAPLDGREDLTELHWKVMEHAHDLYVRTARALAAGAAVPRIAQSSIADGRTFYTREWSALPMLRARLNFLRWSPALVSGERVDRELAELRLLPMQA